MATGGTVYNFKKKPTPKMFEQVVARHYRNAKDMLVVRADAGNYLPDYLCFTKPKSNFPFAFFVEAKRYCSCTSLKQVFDKVRKHQAKQTRTILALSYVIPVRYVIMLKDLSVSEVDIENGKIVAQSGPHSIPFKTKITPSEVRKLRGKCVRPSPRRRIRPSMR